MSISVKGKEGDRKKHVIPTQREFPQPVEEPIEPQAPEGVYPRIMQPILKKYLPPVGTGLEYVAPPVPLIGLAGVNHQWICLHDKPLYGTFVDKPEWTLVPDNWRSCYPPWQIDMLTKTYINPPVIYQHRLVEVDFEAFRQLCFEKDRKKMAWTLDYYGKAPQERKKMLAYWQEKWGEPYEEEES